MKVYGVIYLIIDGTNDKEYVGQTRRSVKRRLSEHKCGDQYIDHAIQKRGKDLFTFAILKECYSQEELDFWERHMIRSRNTRFPNGYNQTDGGETVKRSSKHWLGRHHTKETLAKMSARRKGEKNPSFGKNPTAEHRSKIAVANRGYSPYKNLLAEIDKHKLSYSAIAKLLNLSITVVSKRMLGKISFMDKDIAKLVEIFGKSAEYLMVRDDGKDSWKPRFGYSPYKNLVAELKKYRLTYVAFAKRMELSIANFSRKMRGERNFTAKDIGNLVRIFGKPAKYLIARNNIC